MNDQNSSIPFSVQPGLENETVKLVPLAATDFERLYAVASDPDIWSMHPEQDRYKRGVFKSFFDEALQSKGAFLLFDKKSGELAGSSRFYNYNNIDNSIFIGYTFYAVKFWGTGFNTRVKHLMLDYVFRFVNAVHFHIGAANYRSQKAIEKLGAIKMKQETVLYPGKPDRLNFVYTIQKKDWIR